MSFTYEYTFRVQGTVSVPGGLLTPAALAAPLDALPGVSARVYGGRLIVRAPWHAAGFAWAALAPWAAAAGADAVRVERAPNPALAGDAKMDAAEVERLLDAGELRPAYRWAWAMPHQREGLAWALVRPGSLLKHPTGAGKTWTAIAAITAQPSMAPAVIVTRASTRLQYAREVERFTTLLPFLCKPEADVRKKDRWANLPAYLDWCAVERQRPVVVVGWESLPDWHPQLTALLSRWWGVLAADEWQAERAGADPLPGLVIFDEAQKGKSKDRTETVQLPEVDDPGYAAAARGVEERGGKVVPMRDAPEVMIGIVPLENIAQSAARLSKAAARRIATTATPVDDRTRDLWGILDLLEPWAWGTFRKFALRYCDGKDGLYGFDSSGSSNEEELQARLGCVMHSVPAEEVRKHLPGKRREMWLIPVSEQVKATGGWAKALKAAASGTPGSQLEVKLAMAASAKRRAVIARVSEHSQNNAKVVIFTARREDCEELAEQLGNLRGKAAPAKVWCGHGGHSQDERREMLLQYAAHPGPCVLVGTGQAWGTGIDGLQCTDLAVFALLPYTPGQLDQWEGRFTRLGQNRPVTLLYPIAEHTADEHLADILLGKLPAVEAITGLDSLAGVDTLLAGREDDPDKFAADVLGLMARAAAEGL